MGSVKAFQNECGGHRWQRIPPSEKRGRVQTSTVTVAVLNDPNIKQQTFVLDHSDIVETTYRGSGPGGQHKNKKDTAVRLLHVPSGIIVTCEKGRSQHSNRANAYEELEKRLQEIQNSSIRQELDSERKKQVGSGQRGDKRRTYRVRDDRVTDHLTGQKTSLEKIMRGELELLA